MKAIIYHNPRCSKSRQTLQILEDNDIDTSIIDYQKTPLTSETIDKLCKGLDVEPQAIIRTGEQLFKDLDLSLADSKTREEWIEILQQNPRLIERPIVEIEGQYAIGRPPENIERLLENIKSTK